jgi:hypothetical protein
MRIKKNRPVVVMLSLHFPLNPLNIQEKVVIAVNSQTGLNHWGACQIVPLKKYSKIVIGIPQNGSYKMIGVEIIIPL